MKNKFIVLRGPAGSGKSTVANTLKGKSKIDTVVIEQDYFNHHLLKNIDDKHALIPKLIEDTARLALDVGYNVILEGVLRKEKYEQAIYNISNKNQGRSFIYYFDVSPEETIRRHTNRDKSKLFSKEEMLSWYKLAAPLETPGEVILNEALSENDIVSRIVHQSNLA